MVFDTNLFVFDFYGFFYITFHLVYPTSLDISHNTRFVILELFSFHFFCFDIEIIESQKISRANKSVCRKIIFARRPIINHHRHHQHRIRLTHKLYVTLNEICCDRHILFLPTNRRRSAKKKNK